MIEVAIMIEGQNGLNWDRWQKIAKTVEELGFVGLYRSDHFTNSRPPDKESLELWTSLTWLASNTSKIEFGPLVSPVSFRHPVLTARMAAAVDDLSGGRLTLGMGAGWQEREHQHFGFDLLDIPQRFKRLEEGLEVVTKLLTSDEPVDFKGDFFNLEEAILLPRPKRPSGPPILIGGSGPKRTLPLAAKYAAEWNAIFLPLEEYTVLNQRMDEELEKQGRVPESLKRSMMTGCEFGRDDKEVKELVQLKTDGKLTPEDLVAQGRIVGTTSQIVDQLGAWAEGGLQRIMLQWLALDDIDRLAAMGQELLPQLK